MKNWKKKYKEKKFGTSNGFWYDLTDGGYIIPADVLVDKVRAKQLQDAINLLEAWKEELDEDDVLNEF